MADQTQHMTKTEAHPYHHGSAVAVFDPNCPKCRDAVRSHPRTCECQECCYRRKHPQLAPREEFEPDYGGVLGADGQVHSDADPGL